MNLVVYYRTRPLEPSFSDQAIREQRDAVYTWLAENPAPVIAEYVEQESDGAARPHLAEAIETCKRTNARLLIARTEPIGSGSPFEPRIRSVTVVVAPKTKREIGHVISNPQDAFPGYSLYLPEYRAVQNVQVYFCNNACAPLDNLEISIASVTSKNGNSLELDSPIAHEAEDHLVPANTPHRFPNLPAGSSILIDHYDPMADGDMILIYAISFTGTSGERRQVRGHCGSGQLLDRFFKLT